MEIIYLVGPVIGAWLYTTGGFMLPFLSIGLLSTMISGMLIFVVPSKLPKDNNCETDPETNRLLSGTNIAEAPYECEGNGYAG